MHLKSTTLAQTLRRLEARYGRLCSIPEIESNQILQWMFGAMLFYFFVTFSIWITRGYDTVEAARAGAVCWPFFQSCGNFYFLHNLPYGYSLTTLYMGLYGIMVLIVYLMWLKRWVLAQLLMSVLLLWKLFVMATNYTSVGPYDYYHVFMTLALLYIPYKEYFLKILFVLFYFMSVTVKFSPAWIEGTYFSSLKDGIPLFPSWFIPVATNVVIFVQVVECWFLLSKKRVLQRISLVFAIFFHLYSGIFVLYDYPSVALPATVILFGPMYRHTPAPFTKRALFGWIIVTLVVLEQFLGFVPHLVPIDRYLTLEGNRFGMYMFESNHQCVATVTVHTTDTLDPTYDFVRSPGFACSGFFCSVMRKTTVSASGSVQTTRYESGTAWDRCDPYEWWSALHARCANATSTTQIEFTFDHSINGGPFYRIVDLANICDVDYKAFAHNAWIMLPPQAPIVGYPVQNWYHN